MYKSKVTVQCKHMQSIYIVRQQDEVSPSPTLYNVNITACTGINHYLHLSSRDLWDFIATGNCIRVPYSDIIY